MGSWLSKGFSNAEEQVAATSSSSLFTRDFFFKSGEDVEFNILDDESTNIRAHFVKGKNIWLTCIQGIDEDICPLCEAALVAGSPVGKAQNQFVFNVLDPREYKDKKDKVHKNQVKIWRVGITLLRVLEKKRSKHGPYSTLDLIISKLGTGQSTSYDIEVTKRSSKIKLPEGEELFVLEDVLAPKTRKELLGILSNSYSAPEDTDDDDDEQPVSWRK